MGLVIWDGTNRSCLFYENRRKIEVFTWVNARYTSGSAVAVPEHSLCPSLSGREGGQACCCENSFPFSREERVSG